MFFERLPSVNSLPFFESVRTQPPPHFCFAKNGTHFAFARCALACPSRGKGLVYKEWRAGKESSVLSYTFLSAQKYLGVVEAVGSSPVTQTIQNKNRPKGRFFVLYYPLHRRRTANPSGFAYFALCKLSHSSKLWRKIVQSPVTTVQKGGFLFYALYENVRLSVALRICFMFECTYL